MSTVHSQSYATKLLNAAETVVLSSIPCFISFEHQHKCGIILFTRTPDVSCKDYDV